MDPAIQAVRDQIPVAKKAIIMDNAATSPIPLSTAQAAADSMHRRAENGENYFWPECQRADKVRERVAQHLGVHGDGIAFMKSTGEGINHVARSLTYPSGSNVVTTSLEFASNLFPWTRLANEGVEVRVVEPDDDGLGITPEHMAQHIDDDTHIVSMSWVTFQTGYKHDVDTIGKIAHEHDAYMFVDAIQGLGAARPPKMRHVDFLACGGIKWLMAPFGAGFLYVDPKVVDDITPDHVGWWSLEDTGTYDPSNVELAKTARRFEIGNLEFPNIMGLGAAVDLIPDIDRVHERVLKLTGQLMEGIQERNLGTLGTPTEDDKRAGIVRLERPDAETLREQLKKHDIRASLRQGAIRFSPHYWATEDEIEQAIAAIAPVK